MKTLVIAEKPSVAQDIVRAITPTAGKFEKHDEYFESDDWLVTSAVGHLVEIQAPEEFDVKRGKWSFANLPVIPPYFDLKPIDKQPAAAAAYMKAKGYSFPAGMLTPEVAKFLPKPAGLPVVVVLKVPANSREGKVVFAESGEMFPEDVEGLKKYI